MIGKRDCRSAASAVELRLRARQRRARLETAEHAQEDVDARRRAPVDAKRGVDLRLADDARRRSETPSASRASATPTIVVGPPKI